MRSASPTLTLLLLLLLPAAAPAQEREIEEAGLPRTTADRLIAIANDPATLRLPGDSHIPADSLLQGDVVVMGALHLAGRIEGDLIVIQGDLEMEPGARVAGDLTVIQGEARGSDVATISGTLTAYQRGSRFVQRGEHRREVAADLPRLRRDMPSGSSFRFSVQGGHYNRVEGLPVMVGPMLDTGGRSPFRAETRLVWRTEGQPTFARDRIGYEVRAEQFLGAGRQLRIGGGVHSGIDPIEAWGLADGENAWSTLLLTNDERDYFERRGWRAFVRATPRDLPLDITVEYRDDRHGVVGAGDPWTLFRSGREWRAQPLVAEGELQSAVVTLEVDTRDDHRDPLDGWFVRTSWHRGLDGALALPVADPGPGAAPDFEPRFSAGFLDVRRYHPMGHHGGLALRGVAGGSLDRDALLPPQYQHALGGVGSLPGHSPFTADCGARSAVVSLERDDRDATMFPFYGCDRFALAQVEYRGPLNLHLGFSPPDDRGKAYRHSHHRGLSWAVFFNAGRAWAGGDWGGIERADATTLYDAGLGLLFGSGGIYWAVPLGDEGNGSTFTVRLNRRF